MIKHPNRERSDIIKETLNNITIQRNIRLAKAHTETDINAAHAFATKATAELQQHFTRDINELLEFADKYKV